MLRSSNPALRDETLRQGDWWNDTAAVERASISGIVNKTSIFAMVMTAAGCGGYAVVQANPGILLPVMIVNMIVVFASFFMIRGSARAARNIGFIYSAFQGFLLGGVAVMLEGMLASRGIAVAGGLVIQAFVVTAGCLMAMLVLYRGGILKGGPMFQRVVMVATVGVMVAALLSFVLRMFGVDTMIFNVGNAFDGGSGALIGLGVTGAILILASLWLIIDFRQAEELVASGAPKEAEWYAAFGLIVTIAWIYLEALKLVYYLAAMNNRD